MTLGGEVRGERRRIWFSSLWSIAGGEKQTAYIAYTLQSFKLQARFQHSYLLRSGVTLLAVYVPAIQWIEEIVKQLEEGLRNGLTPSREIRRKELEDGYCSWPVSQENGCSEKTEFLVTIRIKYLLAIVLKCEHRDSNTGESLLFCTIPISLSLSQFPFFFLHLSSPVCQRQHTHTLITTQFEEPVHTHSE